MQRRCLVNGKLVKTTLLHDWTFYYFQSLKIRQSPSLNIKRFVYWRVLMTQILETFGQVSWDACSEANKSRKPHESVSKKKSEKLHALEKEREKSNTQLDMPTCCCSTRKLEHLSEFFLRQIWRNISQFMGHWIRRLTRFMQEGNVDQKILGLSKLVKYSVR